MLHSNGGDFMRRTSLALALTLLAASGALAATYTVPTDGTLHAVVGGAVTGDTVNILDGSYTLTSTLNIAQGITLSGQSEAGVVIDIDCGSGYGLHPSVGGVVLENFTLNVITGGAEAGYVIHASGTPNVQDGLTVRNVTIQGGAAHPKRRAGLDIHGYDNVVIDGVTSLDATWGNGFQLTGCHHVTMTGCVSANNAWGSVAIYCSQYLVPTRACDDVYVDAGTCSFTDWGGLGNTFVEDQFGLVSTNVVFDGYEWLVRNDEFRTGAEGFTFYRDDLADAQAFAAFAFAGFEDATTFEEIAGGEFAVYDGMSIQAAIDAAEAGDTINVGAGHYEEQLHVYTEDLTLAGAGAGVSYVDSPAGLTLFYTTSADNYPIVFIDGVDAFAMSGFTVDGLGRGNANYRFQGIGFWNAGGSVTDVDVDNVIDTPFSGAQHGVGVYAYNDDDGPYTVTLTRVAVTNYQKGAIALNGTGLTAHVTECTTVGAGPTDVTAQNGIQMWGGLGGTITDCDVSGCIYTGGGWAASGLLLIQAGTVDITGSTVVDNSPGVYCQDTSATADGLTIVNSDVDSGNGFYVRIQDPLAGKAGGEPAHEAEPSPFGDGGLGGGAKGTAAVTLTGCDFTGQITGYGLSMSNYQAADLIDVTMTNCLVTNWGWGVVCFGSGGEISLVATDNGLVGNDGFFYNDAALTTVQDASGNDWGTTDPAILEASILGAVDFTPWLAGGAATMPGYAGDFSVLWVDDLGEQIGGGRIQEGVDLVTASTINIGAGTYPGAITIPAGMPMTLDGAGTTSTFLAGGMLLPDGVDGLTLRNFAITGEGAAGAVIRAGHPNNDFTMDHVLLDGAGTWSSYAGGRLTGDVTVTHCEFVDVAGWSVFDSASTGWETVMGTVTFTHNHIHECDGAVAFRGDSADRIDLVVAHDNVWENINENFSSPSQAWACFEAHNVEVLQFHDNIMTNVAENSWGEGQGLQTWKVGDIDIYDNQFIDCWQGIWLPGLGTEPAPTGSIHDNSFDPISDFAVYTTHGGGGFTTGILDARGNWWGDATGPYHPTLNPGGLGYPVSDDVLFDPWAGMGAVAALPASSGPINCGETVTLTFRYEPDAYTPELRGFTVTVDCSAELSFGAGDITDLGAFDAFPPDYFQALDNGDGTFTMDSAILGGTSGLATAADLFSITFHPAADGAGAVTIPAITLRDMDNQDIGALATGATITVDCTAPPGVTDLTSAPAHEEVSLDWTMADASDVDHYEIWRAVWHTGDNTTSAYPEYDDVNPTEPVWPADRAAADASAEWTMIDDTVAGTATSYVDAGAPRGIYYYEVYAVDAADNIGPGAGPSNRATNYWLGDVDAPWDGLVDVLDIDELGATYGYAHGHGSYDNHCDVGPTDDRSGYGIPETDSTVGFEDLMIFALNYGNVAPRQPAEDDTPPAFVWQRLDDTTWALMLEEGCTGLKGVRLTARLPEGVTCTAVAGELLDGQTLPAFVGSGHAGLDVGAALLGRGAAIAGDGELLRVTFSADVVVAPHVTARGVDNADLEASLSTVTEAAAPRVFAVRQNFPNPFNPSTTISFDLPEARGVRLGIYAVDGSLVRTLVGGELPAGRHDIVWDGRDDRRQGVATGTYFYRLEAGPDIEVRKMLLMK